MGAIFPAGVRTERMAVGADRGRSDVSAVWLRASAQLRGRARATLLLAVLVGLAGGMVLAAVAGARRTDAALPRFLARDRTIDAVVELPEAGLQPRPDTLGRQLRTLAALPEV